MDFVVQRNGISVNILSINTFFPCPPRRGMDVIYLNLLKLQATEHKVTIVTLSRSGNEDRHLDDLAAYCDRVVLVKPRNVDSRLYKVWYRILYSLLSVVLWRPRCTFYGAPPELRAAIRGLVADAKFDLVEIHHSTSASLRRDVGRVPCALYLYDLHFRAKERLAATKHGIGKLLARLEASQFRRFETQVLQYFDLLLLGQHQDKAVVDRLAVDSRNVALMPNVIDTDIIVPHNTYQPASKIAVFVGAMTHHANVDAVLHFFRNAWKEIRSRVPDAEWWIVGGSPPPEIRSLHGTQGVTVHADVPDVRPYISAASVYIAPLRIGSGVKVKIMEALSLGKAIVATDIAAEGMGLTPGRDLEVADLDKPFADAVVRLWQDDRHRETLEHNARKAAVDLFGVSAGRCALTRIYAYLVDATTP